MNKPRGRRPLASAPTFKRIANPFATLRAEEHQRAIELGVIATAAAIGAGKFSKPTYSRTLGGRLQLVHPEVVRHLKTAITLVTQRETPAAPASV